MTSSRTPLAVVGIHLNVATDALDENQPDEARDALRLAQSVRGQAMADLATLIGILRDPTGPHGAHNLAALAEQARATGLDVRLDGHTTDLPAPVALAAYRVVQESLTNVLKHADATRVTVHIEHGPAEVTVTVTDDGTGGTQDTAGHGIAGMRERIIALGGTLDAGPAASGGFAVRARIPMPGSAT
jgi:signal transduction histidine kinase